MEESQKEQDEELIAPKYEGKWYRPTAGCRLLDDDAHQDRFALSLPVDWQGLPKLSFVVVPDAAERDEAPWIALDESLDGPEWQPRTSLETYDPLEVPDLHREFSRLEGEDAILRFAGKYGLLGRRTVSLRYHKGSYEPEDRYWTWGESLEQWQEEIARMRTILRVWELYRGLERSATAPELLRYARFDSKGKDSALSHPVEDRMREDLRCCIVLYAFAQNLRMDYPRLRETTKDVLGRWINERLAGGTHGYVDVAKGAEVRLVPRDLLSAIYVQLALEVVGRRKKTKKCENPRCDEYFPVLRKSRKYCSARCKMQVVRSGN
ncbi:hypothetical protein EON82_21080 [bacterium]|nr:MAG: hypothetical protein EON82_21080 [bacterium]